MQRSHHYKIIIVGGGSAGISVAARLTRAGLGDHVAIIEPSERHYYQPLWTLVAGGVFSFDKSVRNTREFIPKGVTWFHDEAVHLSGEHRTIRLKSGVELTCDWMVICPGIEMYWDAINGVQQAGW